MVAAIVQRQKIAPLEFTPEQRKMIRTSFLNGASESEASVLLELARLRALNPILKQIHFVKREKWNPDTRQTEAVWSAQVGIDGFRAIADRTGLYDGQDEPEFIYEKDGRTLQCCKVRVYRKDWSRAAVGVAFLSEYIQTKKDGTPTQMWTKQHIMLSKCAEAAAFRKAFPEDTSGLYAPEEMGGDEKELNAAPGLSVVPSSTAASATVTVTASPPPDAPKAELPTETKVPASGSRTAKLKAELAKKVKPTVEGQGQLIAEPATLRAEPVAVAAPDPSANQPIWDAIKRLFIQAGIKQDRWDGIYKGCTGKALRRSTLAENDIAAVAAALVVISMKAPAQDTGDDLPL